MKKLIGIVVVLIAAAMAMAFSAFTKSFNETYKVQAGSTLGKAACGVCHVGAKGGKLNPYGLDLDKAMKADKARKVTPALLAKIEGLDSDKDGVKNIDEIKKDTNPGVAN